MTNEETLKTLRDMRQERFEKATKSMGTFPGLDALEEMRALDVAIEAIKKLMDIIPDVY